MGSRLFYAEGFMTSPRLVFVYNADSGVFNTVSDIAHKLFSPETYACNLCALTHGYFSVRQEWEGFVQSLPVSREFLHRDQFKEQYPDHDVALPALFLHSNEKLSVLLAADEINAIHDLSDLKQRIEARLADSEASG